MRRLVVEVARIFERKGLVEAFGHVSVRLPEGDAVLVTPARAPGVVSPDQLAVVDLKGRVLEPGGPLPLELPMHLAVYRRRPDVHAICRTHSPCAAAFGCSAEPIRPVHGFGGMLGAHVPVYPDPDLVTTDAQGEAVAEALGEAAAVLLRGNGSLVTGSSLPEACLRAIYLEESAAVNLRCRVLGQPQFLSAEELTRRARWFEREWERAWEYYRARYGDGGEGAWA